MEAKPAKNAASLCSRTILVSGTERPLKSLRFERKSELSERGTPKKKRATAAAATVQLMKLVNAALRQIQICERTGESYAKKKMNLKSMALRLAR
jgi:hypothetical protein